MTRLALLAFAALLQGPPSLPQGPIRVTTRAEPDTALIGQPVTLLLELAGVPADAEVLYPQLPDSGSLTGLGPPQPLGRGIADRSVRYPLAAWSTGDLTIELADLRVVGRAGEARIRVPAASLHVGSVLPQAADPDTLAWQPPRDVVGPNWSPAEKAAAVVLALALLALTALYTRRRGRVEPVPPPPARPPRELALEALDRLEQSGLLTAGEFKAFHAELAHTLRRFLAETDRRWGPELTSDELIAATRLGGLDISRIRTLDGILAAADLVKFARGTTSRQRSGRLLDSSRLWLREFERVPARVEVEEEPEPVSESEAMAVMDELFAKLDGESEVGGDGRWAPRSEEADGEGRADR